MLYTFYHRRAYLSLPKMRKFCKLCSFGHKKSPLFLSAVGGLLLSRFYSIIWETTPEATVRPPSRIAKRRPLVHGDGRDQRALHVDVVARHNHLNALGQLDVAGNVGGAEVELRTVAVEEGSMTAAFFLGQNVNLALELGVGMNGAGLGDEPDRARSRCAVCRGAARRCCRLPSA